MFDLEKVGRSFLKIISLEIVILVIVIILLKSF